MIVSQLDGMEVINRFWISSNQPSFAARLFALTQYGYQWVTKSNYLFSGCCLPSVSWLDHSPVRRWLNVDAKSRYPWCNVRHP